jgi:hypothetical protein
MFDFTGCTAHAEVTYSTQSRKILHVQGQMDHNQGCQDAMMKWFPKNPLHLIVFEWALKQLKMGSALTDIQEANRQMINSGAEGFAGP